MDDPSEELRQALEHLPNLAEDELPMLAAGVVAEMVNRGLDHETATRLMHEALDQGIEASRTFDRMVS